MNFVKRVLMFVGFVVLAAALVSVLAPKATHALVATLVQVANTSANPVPNTDVDNSGRATTVLQNCDGRSLVGDGQLSCDTGYNVPAGQRFVIEELEANCTAPKGNNIYSADVVFVQAGFGTFHMLPLISQGVASGQAQYIQNQRVRYYADPGSQLTFYTQTTDTSGNTSCYFAASGYLISYP